MTPSISDVETKLKSAIAQILQAIPKEKVNEAFKTLSECYRTHNASKVTGLASSSLFYSYIGSRMPATFGVVSRVLNEYTSLGGETPKSIIDVGAGPATASFAALHVFGDLQINLFEKEKAFQDLALTLAKHAKLQPLIDARWHLADLTNVDRFMSGDLSIASYSLGEMEFETAKRIAVALLNGSRLGLVIIEPGTPSGFSRVRDLREALLQVGAHIAAPCAHPKACPMTDSDFCHFSERIQREEFHRLAKGASLPFEDEKFSYLIVTKIPLEHYEGRLVKKPIKSSGHVTLDICTNGKLVRKVAARSNKSFYKTARKSEWGDRVTLG